MSRKSRQRSANKKLRHVIPSVWLAAILLAAGLWIGILGVLGPWISQPTPLKDTIPVSATMTEVEGDYEFHRTRGTAGWELGDIFIYFEDHERLIISDIIAHETLLEKLESYPAGTVFDMRIEPNSISIITLAVDGVEVLSYEAACRAIRGNSIIGVLLGIVMLAIAGYAAWSLIMTWRYRRVI